MNKTVNSKFLYHKVLFFLAFETGSWNWPETHLYSPASAQKKKKNCTQCYHHYFIFSFFFCYSTFFSLLPYPPSACPFTLIPLVSLSCHTSFTSVRLPSPFPQCGFPPFYDPLSGIRTSLTPMYVNIKS